MNFNINNDNELLKAPDEILDEIIQHYPPGPIGSATPYSKALAEKHRRQKAKEAAEIKRHQDTQRQLEELKKPHRPSFWLLVISVILTLLALCVAILGLPQVQQVFFQKQKSQTKNNELLQQNELSLKFPIREAHKVVV